MMGSSTQAADGNDRTLVSFLRLRMIVLALVVGAGIMIIQLGKSGISVGPLYVLLTLSYVVGGMVYWGHRLGSDTRVLLWGLLVTDVLLQTAMLHYSGGAASHFSPLFCLSIIAAAFLFEVAGGLGIALLASVGYVLYGALEANGILSPPVFQNVPVTTPGFLQAYMHVTLFFLVGAVSGYLTEHTRIKGKQLLNAETVLKQLQVDTDQILKHMSSGVLVIDSNGRVVTINPTAELILDITKEEIVDTDIRSVFGDDMSELARELFNAIESENSKKRHELTIERGSETIPLGISISVLRDEDGGKRGIIAVFQDLTEVRGMQERIRKADRLAAIGELSAGIAHEIRNPLASISGSIEMLHNDLRLSDENKRLMELIMNESDRLDRIISDFLEFARLRSPSRNKVVVTQCLDDVLVLLGNNATVGDSIKTEVKHLSGNISVGFDEEQMKQVFLNLALNAYEAMPGKGTVTITTQLFGDEWLRVSFEDEGDGIKDEVRDRLFEPFFTTKDGGTGLGLAIANKIVEAHGGRLEARNRAGADAGRGAEFTILIPVAMVEKDSEEVLTTVGLR